MAHNWRAVQMLEGSNLRPGWWIMFDRGRRVGQIEEVKVDGLARYRGWTSDEKWTLGFAETLSAAAAALWEWDQLRR